MPSWSCNSKSLARNPLPTTPTRTPNTLAHAQGSPTQQPTALANSTLPPTQSQTNLTSTVSVSPPALASANILALDSSCSELTEAMVRRDGSAVSGRPGQGTSVPGVEEMMAPGQLSDRRSSSETLIVITNGLRISSLRTSPSYSAVTHQRILAPPALLRAPEGPDLSGAIRVNALSTGLRTEPLGHYDAAALLTSSSSAEAATPHRPHTLTSVLHSSEISEAACRAARQRHAGVAPEGWEAAGNLGPHDSVGSTTTRPAPLAESAEGIELAGAHAQGCTQTQANALQPLLGGVGGSGKFNQL